MDQQDSVLSQDNQNNNQLNADAVADSSPITLVRKLFSSDFEIEGVKDYYNNGIFLKQINGWTGSGLIEVNTRYGGAQDSDFLIELNRDPTGKFQDAPSISRTLATTGGALYTLDFDFASRPGLTELNNTIGLFIDGVQVRGWTVSGKGSTALQWQTGEFSFVGTGSEVVIEIRDLTTDENLLDHGRGMLLDNISMTETLESQTSDETSTVLIDVLAGENDAQGQGLTITSLDSDVYHNEMLVGHAELVMIGGRQQIQFTPVEQLKALAADETAELTFNYTVVDSEDNSASATASLTVQGINNTPDAAQDAYVMRYAGQITVDVRDNDTDAEGDALNVTHINGTELVVGQAMRVEIYQGVKPVRADITLQEDGQLQIDHVGGNSLRDLYFEYTLSDGNSSTKSIAAIQILPKVKADITDISEDTDTPGDFRTADLDGLTISGTVTDALLPEETLQITWPRSGGWQTVTVDNDTLSWSFADNTGRSNGDTVGYTVRIQDARGRNLDVDKQTVVFESDVSPAEITITDFSDDTGFSDSDRITTDRTLIVHGTLSEELGDADRIEVTWDGGQTWYTATVNGTNWSYDSTHFEHAKLARPLYEVRIINDKGHVGDVDEARVIVDSLPGRYNTISLDSISEDTGTEGDFFTQDNTLTISGSLLRNLGNDQMVWVCSDDDPDWRVQATVSSDDTWSVLDSRIHDLNDEITYTVIIIDLAGNVMDEDSQLVTIDNLAPAVEVAITAISEDTGVADFRTADLNGITVSGTVGELSEDEAVQVSLNGVDWYDTTVDITSGTWTYDDTASRNDGDEVTYRVRVIDGAGNVGNSGQQEVIFELSVPAIEITAITTDTGIADFNTADLDGLIISGTVENLERSQTVQISEDGLNWTTVNVNRANDTWSYDENYGKGVTTSEVIKNGSFSSGNQHWSVSTSGSAGWIFKSSPAYAEIYSDSLNNSSLYQTIDVVAGQKATLNFDIASTASSNRTLIFEIFVDGKKIYSESSKQITSDAGGNWQFTDRSVDFTPTDSSVKLEFKATLSSAWGSGGDDIIVDNVSVEVTNDARVTRKVGDEVTYQARIVDTVDGVLATDSQLVKFISCPILLDLDNDGVETLSASVAGLFDLDADGELDRIGWVGKDDALLVRDLNGDGEINNGAELFGDSTLLQNGSKASDGYEALAELDDNGDGVIDSSDDAFVELQLWQDKNSDGVTQEGELQSLQSAGVASLNAAAQASDYVDENGSLHGLVSSYTTVDGEEREAVDVWFAVDGSGNNHAATNADDILTGGEGLDTFIWQADDQGSAGQVASDIITDFSLQEDVLDLSGMLDFDTADDVIGDYLSLTSNGQGDAVIEVSSQGAEVDQRIVLENVSADVAMESNLISSLYDEGQLVI